MPEFDSTIRYADLPGFTGYKVGTDGSVWSQKLTGFKQKKPRLSDTWHPLKPSPNQGNGYLCVGLSRGHLSARRKGIHVLVLETFVGPCPAGCQVRHLDGDKTNNSLANLAWGTPAQNSRDRVLHGRQHTRLTADQIPEIRRLFSAGWSCARIGKRFGVADGTVAAIIEGRTWAHVPGTVDRSSRPKINSGQFKPGHRAKLTPEIILEIRRLRASGMSCKEVAAMFNVSTGRVTHVTHKAYWSGIKSAADPEP